MNNHLVCSQSTRTNLLFMTFLWTLTPSQNGRLRFCGGSWGFKIYIRWNIVLFGKSYVRSKKLDVQESNFSFAQFNRITNDFLGPRIKVVRSTSTWFMVSDCLILGNTTQNHDRTGVRWNLVRFGSYTVANQLDENKLQFRTVQRNQKWYSRTWFMRSDRRSSWKHESES